MTTRKRHSSNTQVASVGDLLKVVVNLTDDADGELMFRGQSRDWPLLPAIGRFPCRELAENWRAFHERVIERFLRSGAPYFSSTPSSDVERWVFAQHHGVPTRLLDTALNPLKAMHFAVSDPREDQYDGVLWVFAYNGWREDLDEKYKNFWDSEITPFLPAQIHPRLTAQEGAFICYPLPGNSDPLPALDQLPASYRGVEGIRCHKFTIPAASKRRMRLEIRMLGARYSLLFPDLDGVAREITLELLEGNLR
ncbi:MAG: FRG domain-containing protein [Burkholderiales bacterium]|nr:FRG domain-containing protein [Burkholderiales bacterium]